MLQADRLKNKVSGNRLPERVAIGMKSTQMSRATGGTPQTSGAGQLGDYKEGCGYNEIFEHRVMWQSGFYDGKDEDWREVGIPMHVIEAINKKIPLENRMTTAQEIGDSVAFLLSDHSSYITGETLKVNGGMFM